MYLVYLNDVVVFCGESYSDAVHAYNDYTDNIAKRGDFVNLWHIKDMEMSIYKQNNAALISANRKKSSNHTLLAGYKK